MGEELIDEWAEKRAGERLSTANMTYGTRVVHNRQRVCLFERYANLRRIVCDLWAGARCEAFKVERAIREGRRRRSLERSLLRAAGPEEEREAS
jgi:hypothetical protein